MLYLEFLFLLLMLYIGSRYGGIGLGVVSGIGLVIEVFIFQMPPTSPPVTVMLIILAVVTCASILEAAGGLKYMLQVAERLLRKNPKRVTLIAPFVTYAMTFMLGTGHAVYSIMPIIGDVALKNGIRPERPMAAASVASQIAITASPISAAVVYYLAQLADIQHDITLVSILLVTIPATLFGTLLMSLYSLRRGKELDDDPDYQARLQDPEWRERIENTTATSLDEVLPHSARNAVLLFISAIVTIVIIAMWPEIRTVAGESKAISMSVVIQMMMLCFGGIILLATKTDPRNVPNGVVFKSGMVAAIAIFGIAWMSDTYFQYAMPQFKSGIVEMVTQYPWSFALALFIVSVVVNSQAATARMMLPVGLGLGLDPALLIGIMPAVYGYFFIPNYPSDIATVNFDASGTTKIGKWYFNHSFMAVGLIGVVSACALGYVLGQIFIA
ncbi:MULTISPECIES: anaerobic C4-dicarboxylate transporter [unclassified Salinivibrio]|uniref:anaerobic C4-dicarboxylate transporter n=1 Tax=unclassified Salinivibrio TaxID=2636825 RepID=UPI00128B4B5E|nr:MULTISPECIES: anaerobic C4-dicarboxylate transporter [unclassified Salinivibrio]MPS33093.1 anaerobic C4-dicarboxylate transporter [Salinivibrio sp. VYel7]MPX94479.1 anaerobic C4-dicarboxylate transporter [Salinivibrio sp. VYel9]MPX95109.1 anaerobic C4-dicarboxylate transporter [Salinivibrio sp. VYel6]MPY00770.1 anaerobic C4-dicarboxylate transporter [Salinivibrio sp. VYel4]MPY03778.1 anaerobic C4-dicarboxylate transporter [Salinivibrio sp. VYel5]